MLTSAPWLEVAGPNLRPSVFVDIRATTLRLAMAFAVEEAGWTLTLRAAEGAARVSDRLPLGSPEPPLDVLVVPPTSSASRRAVDAFAAGIVRAVVPTTTPRDLPHALELVGRGLSVLPTAMVDAALGWPALRPRLEHTLHLVLRGCTNRHIAAATHQSEATVKRDVAELLRLFDAPNRLALAATATRLGYEPTH
jgi:DNA-binding CsgD family transcriptional regulator